MKAADGKFYDFINNNKVEKLRNSNQRNLETKVQDDITSVKIAGEVVHTIKFKGGYGAAKIKTVDENDNIVLNVTEIGSDSEEAFSVLVYHKLDKNGAKIGLIRIPLEDYYNFPLNHMKTDENGQAYVMALKEDYIDISKIIWGKNI